MELISKLGIDWKLISAQIINFALLLFVLYKFAYKPILDMLDKRSKLIEKGVNDAKKSEELLQKMQEQEKEKIAAAAREVGKMLENAKRDAEAMKKDIVAAASAQSDDMLRKTRLQMAEEKEKILVEIRREITPLIVRATSKILQREFSDADQQRLMKAVTEEIASAK